MRSKRGRLRRCGLPAPRVDADQTMAEVCKREAAGVAAGGCLPLGSSSSSSSLGLAPLSSPAARTPRHGDTAPPP